MSQAHLGCFCGTVTPNVNMLDIFKQNERADNPNSILNFGQMSLRKLSMICPEGTKVKINGKEIPLITGIFELGMDQINITSLEFSASAAAAAVGSMIRDGADEHAWRARHPDKRQCYFSRERFIQDEGRCPCCFPQKKNRICFSGI